VDDNATARPASDGPQLPDDITADELDPQIRGELVALARPIADTVARRLVAAGRYLDEDPELAYQHAVAARRLASRIAVVREAVGLAAYKAGEWQTAVSEIRTYHRMTGKQTHLAVLADCERALGRPERAIDLYRSAQRQPGNTAETIELLIVAAGARSDMGQKDAAVAMLQIRELTSDAPWVSRLRYAYADALLESGRREEAREWFSRAADADPEGETDAAERLLDLDGITIEEDEMEDPDLALDLAHREIDGREQPEREAELRDSIADSDVRPRPDELVFADGPDSGGNLGDDVLADADEDDDLEDDDDHEDDEDDDEDDDDEGEWEMYEPPSSQSEVPGPPATGQAPEDDSA
jgi:tetratricopeptide (TPR) repeat protein